MNECVSMNKMVKYSSLIPVPELDDNILISCMKSNEYRSVVSVSETCKTLNDRANKCSKAFFNMPLRDRLIENVIVMYTITHYASIIDFWLGIKVLIASPDTIKTFGQKTRAAYGVENRQDLLSFADSEEDRKRLLKTLDMVESFVKQTLDPQDQEKVERLYTFLWYAHAGHAPAGCSMLMLNILLKMIQDNRQNSVFCLKLVEAVQFVYNGLLYCYESKNDAKFPEHRKMLESIIAFDPEAIENSNQKNVEGNVDRVSGIIERISDIIERKGGIILLGVIIGYHSLRWFCKDD